MSGTPASKTDAAFRIPFAVGQVVTNKALYTACKCACEGSVRYSSAYDILALVSNLADPRHTGGEWRDNVLYFTGSGKVGDQDINKGANKRLKLSLESGIAIYYFEVHRQGQYVYGGQMASAGAPFQKAEPGADGKPRQVWIFPLRLLA